MAHKPTGLELSKSITILDRTVRTYTFEFPVSDTSQLRVEWRGQPVPTGAWNALINDEGTGGSIELLDRIRTQDAVTLIEGQVLRIYRDTTVARDTPLNTLADAGQELADRPALSEDAVQAIVRSLTADWAQEGSPDAIPPGKLSNATVAALDPIPAVIRNAAIANSLFLSGNDLIITSDSGQDGRADLRPVVRANVEPWAWAGGGIIPDSRLQGPRGQSAAEVLTAIDTGVQDWAQAQNTQPIPGSKLTQAPFGVRLHEEGALLGTVRDLNFVGMDVEASAVGSTGTVTLTLPPLGLSQAAVEAAIAADVASWARASGTGRLFAAGKGNVDVTEEADGWVAQYVLPPVVWHLDTLADGVFSNFPLSLSSGVIGNSAQLPGTFIIDGVNLNLRGPGYDNAADTFQITLDQGVNLPLLEGYALDITNDATPPATHRLLFADVFEARVDPLDSDRRILLWRGVPADIVTVGTNDFSILVPVGRRSYVPSPTDTDMVGWVLKLGTNKVPGWAAETGSPGMGGGGLSLAAVQTEIDTRVPSLVEDFAEVGQSTTIPDARFGADLPSQWDDDVNTLADARITAGVKSWARTGGAMVPDNQIPSGIARDSEIATWARSTSPTGTIPNARLPSVFPTKWNTAVDTISDQSVTDGVEDWARDDSTLIPAAKLTNAPGGLAVQDSGAARSPAGGTQTMNFRNGLTVTQSGTEVTVDADAGITLANVQTQITQRVAAWARTTTGGGTGRIPASRALAAPANTTEITAGTSSTLRSWSSAAIRQAINAILPSWARTGDTSPVPDGKLPALATDTEVSAVTPGTVRRLFSVDLVRKAIAHVVQDWARDTTTQIPASKLQNAPGGATAGFVKGVGALPAAMGRALRDLWLAPGGLYERTAGAGEQTLDLEGWVSTIGSSAGGVGGTTDWYAGYNAYPDQTLGNSSLAAFGTRPPGMPDNVVAFVASRNSGRTGQAFMTLYVTTPRNTGDSIPVAADAPFGPSFTLSNPAGTGDESNSNNPAVMTLTAARPNSYVLPNYPLSGTAGVWLWSYAANWTPPNPAQARSPIGDLSGATSGTYTIPAGVELEAADTTPFNAGAPEWSLRIPERPRITTRGLMIADTGSLPTNGTVQVSAGPPVVPAPLSNNRELRGNEALWRLAGSTAARNTNQSAGAAFNRGYRHFGGTGLTTGFIYPPGNPPSDAVDGIWAVSKVGGTEIQRAWLPWGPGGQLEEHATYPGDAEVILHFRGGRFNALLPTESRGAVATVTVRYTIISTGWAAVGIFGRGQDLPAMSTIELFEHGAFID